MVVEGVETQNVASLQLTSGLDFLSIQAYRLWMEHPSRGKVKAGFSESIIRNQKIRNPQSAIRNPQLTPSAVKLN
jgi:hypothetical protein